MRTREDVIKFCLGFTAVYEDCPFKDKNWTLMRHHENKKMFASICFRDGCIWVNVKCNPNLVQLLRQSFDGVVPAYHMNKIHWNSIILNGTVPEDEIKNMIYDSYLLTK